ncbi:MAG: hypothetical protein HRU36_02895 [Rickettsiales bacterium]|nr:hypothetical protein [Rickettsiales bacterium]
MSKAKTAASAKGTKKEFLFNGKKIKPVKFISLSRNFMSAQYESGDLVLDEVGVPMAWKKINKQAAK